jgi:hypothetical protein
MSAEVRFAALYAAWLIATVAETRELAAEPAGVHIDVPHAPHQWHSELPFPRPVMLPPVPFPVGRPSNNAMIIADQARRRQENDALFTMEVARKNRRNAALFHLLQAQAVVRPVSDDILMTSDRALDQKT